MNWLLIILLFALGDFSSYLLEMTAELGIRDDGSFAQEILDKPE
jgi:hypothetical protein